MKRSKIPYYPSTTIICTDGSTLNVDFPYVKNDFYINPSYTSIKNQAGPWKDVRASHRKRFSHLYTITKSDNN